MEQLKVNELLELDVNDDRKVKFEEVVYEVNSFIEKGKEEARKILGEWFDLAQYYATNNLEGHDTRYDDNINLFVYGSSERSEG